MSEAGLTERIAGFAVGADGDLIPASAKAVARLSMLDWSAVMLAGLGEPVSVMVRRMVAEEGGAPAATVFGLDDKRPARAAALANGAASHALDYDDTHFAYVGHPSVAVLPAALAIAEKTNASGAELLEAFLIGVETACRVGRFLGSSHYQRGFHQTATSGAFGATAACARLMALSVEQTRHALGIAATRASGLKSQFGTMGKPFHAGMAAANGVEAATLASFGLISRPDGIECEQGFAGTHAGGGGEAKELFADLGHTFWFENVSYKHHACCHGTHAVLEVLALIRNEPSFDVGAVTGVTIQVNPRWLRVCDIAEPKTGLEAKFSYRLTAAMALAGVDTAALASFDDAICQRPDLVRLRDIVTVKGEDAIADTAATVEVQLAPGATLAGKFDLDDAVPLAMQQEKLRAKAASLIGAPAAERLWQVISELENRTAAEFAAALAVAPGCRQ
jgi:2-methylcitrate dehydratase PrpD